LTERELARLLPARTDVAGLLAALQADYRGRGVELVRSGGSWAFATAPDLAEALAHARRPERRLSRAAMETLAIVAYHQPLTRTDIEDFRGVQLGRGTLDALFALGWITPCGRRETPGRPVLWGTTDGFLRHFALESLRDLPDAAELRAAGLLDRAWEDAAAAARAAAGEERHAEPPACQDED
jgi:segregation and condensation protein B